MPTAQRRADASVIERLLAAPQAFDFVQAVTILLRWLEEQGVPPGRALREHLRFANSLRLGFPASEIEDLRLLERALMPSGGRDDAPPAGAGAPDPAELQFLLTPSFMGLLGVHGTLPLHYTERIQLWQATRQDQAPRAFLDLFSGRMLALYYTAWRKHRVEAALADGRDDFLPRLLALAGLGSGAQDNGRQDNDREGGDSQSDVAAAAGGGVADASIAFFAGLLQQRPRSAVVLQRLLAAYFAVPVAVEENVGHWCRLERGEQSALGATACLGENTLLGARSWRPDLRARLRIGPLTRAQFERFLPNGDMAAALRRLLSLFAVPGVDFEVQLVLRADAAGRSQLAGVEATPRAALEAGPAAAPAAAQAAAQAAALEGAPGAATRLGRDSFLLSGPESADRADMRYLVQPMAGLPPLRRPAQVAVR